jgi:dihydrofolate reductase
MRKIVVTQFMSLDGVIENPGWSMPYWGDDIAAFKGEESDAAEMLLLGRVTYDGFAQAWPQSQDEGAPKMNSMPKYVISNTLKVATWNNTTIIHTLDEVAKLKQGSGGNILVYGSGKLVNSLIAHNLVDDYRLLVYPVVLGAGQRLFADGTQTTLKLVESKVFASGVVGLCYQPADKA